jgi:hypothetical protein
MNTKHTLTAINPPAATASMNHHDVYNDVDPVLEQLDPEYPASHKHVDVDVDQLPNKQL